MKFMRNTRFAFLGLLLIVLGLLVVPAHAAPAAQTNLLANAGFEEGTYAADSDQVPVDWSRWWASPADDCQNTKPIFNRSTVGWQVRSGSAAASYTAEDFKTYNAGLYQEVNVTPGKRYRFTAYGFAWSTDEPGTAGSSDGPASLMIGIDPTGGTNPFAGSVVWSAAAQAMDAYAEFSVEAATQSDKITVFVRSKPQWCLNRNVSFWDDASLIEVGDVATSTAQPSATSDATNTPAPTPTHVFVFSTPDAQGRIIHNVREGDTLSEIAWRYGVSMDRIKELNGMTSDVVVRGTQLIIRPGNATETPTPAPTSTPEPTEVSEEPADSGDDSPAQPTEAPADDTGAAGNGTVCVLSWNDQNANGVHEPTENAQANITITLEQDGEVLQNYTTDGVNEPYCFADLTPGVYQVSWTADNFQPTTEQTWQVEVMAGSILPHEFGVQSADASEEPASGPPDTERMPTWLIALIGAVGVILVLGGVGLAGYVFWLRQRV